MCDTNEKEMVRKRSPELYGGAPCSGESKGTTPCLEEDCVRKGILEKCMFAVVILKSVIESFKHLLNNDTFMSRNGSFWNW